MKMEKFMSIRKAFLLFLLYDVSSERDHYLEGTTSVARQPSTLLSIIAAITESGRDERKRITKSLDAGATFWRDHQNPVMLPFFAFAMTMILSRPEQALGFLLHKVYMTPS